jgi:hypothetical protein
MKSNSTIENEEEKENIKMSDSNEKNCEIMREQVITQNEQIHLSK